MDDLERLVEHYMNGDLERACRLAVNESSADITASFVTYANMPYAEASTITDLLKTYCSNLEQ